MSKVASWLKWFFFAGMTLAVAVSVAISCLLWQIHPALSLVVDIPAGLFLVTVLFFWFRAGESGPSLPRTVKIGEAEPERLKVLAGEIAASGKLNEVERERVMSAMRKDSDVLATLKEILEVRKEECRGVIRQHGLLVFTSTAISQNGALDAFAVLALNIKMAREIARKLGVSMNLADGLKIYGGIALAALVADTLEDLQIEEVINGIFPTAVGVAGIATATMGASVAQGSANALVTLRIGYLTRATLLAGVNSQPQQFRREASSAALRDLPGVVKDGAMRAPKAIFQKLGSWFTR